jgi:hypothetical protein
MDERFFSPLQLQGEHLCDVRITAAPAGPGKIESPWGAMLVDYIAEGEFDGPRLSGRVLPGGGDWPAVSNDGAHSMQIDARAVWQTRDGAKLYVRYEGFLVLPEAAADGPMDITQVDPSEYYFRTTPIFRTGDPRYLWLNKVVCVGVGRFAPGGLGYRIHRIA